MLTVHDVKRFILAQLMLRRAIHSCDISEQYNGRQTCAPSRQAVEGRPLSQRVCSGWLVLSDIQLRQLRLSLVPSNTDHHHSYTTSRLSTDAMSAVYDSAPIQLDESENIRLIEILSDQPQGDSSLIDCELHVVSLQDSPDYTALSYVWGPPTPA
jgi:hypothetical protein